MCSLETLDSHLRTAVKLERFCQLQKRVNARCWYKMKEVEESQLLRTLKIIIPKTLCQENP